MKTIEQIINERIITESDGYSQGRISLCVIADIAKEYSNQKLDEAASKSIEMIYDRQDTKLNTDGGIILRNFQVCYAVSKQDVLSLKDEL